MEEEFPLLRFEEFGGLSQVERVAVAALGDAPRQLQRNQRLRGENEVASNFFLLVKGWVAASHTLPNGTRQILKVHLPGDALGTPSMCMTKTVEDLVALTDISVISVPLERFSRLFEDHPRIVARFMLSIQLERIALMDRLASIGKTSGQSRVASFILETFDRLEPLGLIDGDSFDMVLTQEQIGDVVGLTCVHVNRTLSALESQGLIYRRRRIIKLLDRSGLNQLSGRIVRRHLKHPKWLPASRG